MLSYNSFVKEVLKENIIFLQTDDNNGISCQNDGTHQNLSYVEVYSKTSLHEETRKTSQKQYKLTP